MTVLTVLLAILVLLLWVPGLSEIIAVILRRKQLPVTEPIKPAAFLFLVPAHNEESLISECVESIVKLDYPPDLRRVIVVADNCDDGTAPRAEKEGAEVLQRADQANPGKPRAIRWALDQLDLDHYDACVIIDADSTVHPAFARALSEFMPLSAIAVQAYFGTRNEWESWLTRLAGVLARCRYEVTYPLRQSAGLNCPLTGNGMCLGTGLLKDGGWQAFSLTENWELYASYTAKGIPIHYARDARLFSEEARSMKEGGTQRRRWLAGRLWVLNQWWRAILVSSRISWHQKLDALAELAGPSPVIHLAIALLLAALSVSVVGGSTGSVLALVALGSLLPLGVTTVFVLAKHPQRTRTLGAFVMLPAYGAWRVLTALRTVLLRSESVWRKTERRSGTPGAD
jgi:1,2-diacylglycerol 3-beta-glucosyltransferase